MKLEPSRQIFENVSNIKYRQNPVSGSKISPMRTIERTEAGGRTDMTNLIVAFHNFANEPNTKLENKYFFCVNSYGLLMQSNN
jgi:hypothetical protein